MATGNFQNFNGAIADLGPLYPFVGGEFMLFLLGLVSWHDWHSWQIRSENQTVAENLEKLRDQPPTD